MYVSACTRPGDERCANEDWLYASPRLSIVLDGLTARTETGCEHGTSWYVAHLGGALMHECLRDSRPLRVALRHAIQQVTKQHPQCDLTNPATPAAAVGILRSNHPGGEIDALILGDVTIVLEVGGELHILEDRRISDVIRTERALSDRHEIGSTEKATAVLSAKHAELQLRNSPHGYWISAAIPSAAGHAREWSFRRAKFTRGILLSDGAARIVDAFKAFTWLELLEVTDVTGPEGLVMRVRELEDADPTGARSPRNKASDDATVIYLKADSER